MNSNPCLLAAACLLALTGVIHSVLGERLIFGRWRNARIVAAGPDVHLAKRHARILWATWHGLSVFAFATAWVAATFDSQEAQNPFALQMFNALIAACVAVGVLVFAATRGTHPGWLALMLSATLLWFGSR